MIKTINKILFYFFLLSSSMLFGQGAIIEGIVINQSNDTPIESVSVYLEETKETIETKEDGLFRFENLKDGKYSLIFFASSYTTLNVNATIHNGQNVSLDIKLDSLQLNLEAIEVEAEKRENYGIRRLRNVEGMAIYAAKKSEVIDLRDMVANLATNNARQVYKGIPGLNIWENDAAGLQLSIGARGLDPNRTSNFNTRQNGYDISADALGYPESYYTPPTQALKRIEIVRGAASLQYGPQFGGLLNFVFKKGNPKKAFEFTSENTIGSAKLFNTFNSIGGTKEDWNYYAFFQRKQGDGFRQNSTFDQNTLYTNITKSISNKFKIGIEYTHMDYLAQQAGGLQDFEFEQDPLQSKRARNWFSVDWNLAALTLDYRLSDKTKINSRSFYLDAQREALGELGPINRPDPLRERDLIQGNYNNFGNETRLIHRYKIKDQINTFLIGTRYYQGKTLNKQGDASDGSNPDFQFLNPTDLEKSEYEFPSNNFALFAENLFNLNKKWSITPGIRFEYIKTASDGFFKERVFSGGQVIFEQKFEDQKSNKRSFVLFGLGTGYKLSQNLEAYANFSQNYRSINFSDLAVVNPNLIIDSLLQDEEGYNVDIGIRGNILNEAIKLDASIFYLSYQNRIGLSEIVVSDPAVVERTVAFRTNIGDARVLGLELYMEADLLKLLNKENKKLSLSIFTNLSILKGEYLSGESAIVGNDVELIPSVSFKTGINFRYQAFDFSYQYAFTAEHFSDATNAEFVVDATRGLIPSYSVQDLSLSYRWKFLKLQTGINNLLNANYFTRRASGYPGPGIIPADKRSFYVTLRFQI